MNKEAGSTKFPRRYSFSCSHSKKQRMSIIYSVTHNHPPAATSTLFRCLKIFQILIFRRYTHQQIGAKVDSWQIHSHRSHSLAPDTSIIFVAKIPFYLMPRSSFDRYRIGGIYSIYFTTTGVTLVRNLSTSRYSEMEWTKP